MIEEVLRLATVFSSLMAVSTFLLALVIGVGGTIERRSAGCSSCLELRPVHALAKPLASQHSMRIALSANRRAF